jgi:hypothetical protein
MAMAVVAFMRVHVDAAHHRGFAFLKSLMRQRWLFVINALKVTIQNNFASIETIRRSLRPQLTAVKMRIPLKTGEMFRAENSHFRQIRVNFSHCGCVFSRWLWLLRTDRRVEARTLPFALRPQSTLLPPTHRWSPRRRSQNFVA